MAFIETPRFPDSALLGATFSPAWSTDVVQYGNGKEQRNANWTYPLVRADLPMMNTIATIETLRDYFMGAQGKLNGFRVKDFSDYKSCAVADTPAGTDQLIGTGDGTTVAFQLTKTYTFGSTTATRQIKKPVSGTVLINVVTTDSPTPPAFDPGDWTVDTTTGIVTFGSPPPASGTLIYAGYEFDTPMRFGNDELNIEFIDVDVLAVSSIPLQELRL